MDKIDKDHDVEERPKKLEYGAYYIKDWDKFLKACKHWFEPVKML